MPVASFIIGVCKCLGRIRRIRVRRREILVLCVLVLAILLFPSSVLARLEPPEGTEDIRYLAESASFVFHARVVSFDSVRKEYGEEDGVATLAVDRWYKGKTQPATVRLKFAYAGMSAFRDGHNCVDLHRSTSWLIFANQGPDFFVFSDDCKGGLPMSSMLSENPKGTWLERLQQDLIFGLQDEDPAYRLANIARLGGLKLPSSAAPLHQFIEYGTEAESKWAIYAALRSGDLSVLPRVQDIVINIDLPAEKRNAQSQPPSSQDAAPRHSSAYGDPESDMALELQKLRDPRAVPTLLRILGSGKTDFVRSCASSALAEIHDPGSARAVAEHLEDSDRYVRYDALVTLMRITHEPDCTFPPGTKDPDFENYIEQCDRWWKRTGSSQPWPQL